MFIIVTEPMEKDQTFNSENFDRDNIIWFEVPVLRQDRYGKPIDKKVIVRHIADSKFKEEFKIIDFKTKKRYLEEDTMVDNFLKDRVEYLNA